MNIIILLLLKDKSRLGLRFSSRMSPTAQRRQRQQHDAIYLLLCAHVTLRLRRRRRTRRHARYLLSTRFYIITLILNADQGINVKANTRPVSPICFPKNLYAKRDGQYRTPLAMQSSEQLFIRLNIINCS